MMLHRVQVLNQSVSKARRPTLARRSPLAVEISDVNFGNLAGAFMLAVLLGDCVFGPLTLRTAMWQPLVAPPPFQPAYEDHISRVL